jgi:hypothetical protein
MSDYPRPPASCSASDLTCHAPPVHCRHMATPSSENLQTADTEWITFPGGELEGKRPRARCPACRERLTRELDRSIASAVTSRHAGPNPICFQCYRTELQRDRALRAAGQLDTASDARFQYALPFHPVNKARLAALKAERSAVRPMVKPIIRQCTDRRRHAQIAARHALLSTSSLQPSTGCTIASGVHAAELQLPESWLPFVVSGRP